MALSNVDELFEAFSSLKVMIIGDVMVDSYLWGSADRISPEAPVPVISVKNREKRLGGAANVARNVLALGAEPIMCSVIGEDEDGASFCDIMAQRRMPLDGIVRSESRVTTIKHRIIAGSQHVLRVDAEMTDPLTTEDAEVLEARVRKLLPQCDVVVFQDYDKGVLNATNIPVLLQLCKDAGVPTVVDPKKKNFLTYKGATLFKPNFKELKEGLHLDFDKADFISLKAAAQQLRDELKLTSALITLSEHGMVLDQKAGWWHEPAHVRSIADVSGAGDTVVATAAASLAAGLSPQDLLALSNLSGGLVCEEIGVVPIDRRKLREEAQALLTFA